MSKLTVAANQISEVAKRLEARQNSAAPELRRIAQYLNDLEGQVSAMPFGMDGGMAPHPMIQPFAQIKQVEPADDREVHKAGVTFKAPKGVSEADIMHAIMDSVRDLGVEIDGFTWQRSESKAKH
jgi:hypothetical protein